MPLWMQCDRSAEKVCHLGPDQLVERLQLTWMYAGGDRGHRPLATYYFIVCAGGTGPAIYVITQPFPSCAHPLVAGRRGMDACTGASRDDGRPGPGGGVPPAAEPPFVRVCAGRDRRTPSARCRIFLACKFGSCCTSFVFIRCGVYLLTSSAALHGGFPVAVRLEKVH
jgi:hypothetical protein